MLQAILQRTKDFIARVPKENRKQYGQFFTSDRTALYMAEMFHFDFLKPEITLLDTGAGTGILSAAAVCSLLERGYEGHIHLVCYETDTLVIPILIENLEYMHQNANLTYRVLTENYITKQPFDDNNVNLFNQQVNKYDYIIGNPPYLKVSKDAPEALHMQQVCHGTPNLYFLFWAMAINNLKENGELVYIVPRSWTSGAYFARFRKYLFAHSTIQAVHLFVSRDEVFSEESVLQETMIIKVKRTSQKPKNINISSCSTVDFSDLTHFQVPYNIVVAQNLYVFLPTNNKEAKVLARINRLSDTLKTLQVPMHTGLVVDFRERKALIDEEEPNIETYPLFYSSHISKDGQIVWPVGKSGEYIHTDRSSLLQSNSNYIFVKRFTSKEEPRRLQCGVYLSSRYPQYKYISTQNKINFIECKSLDMLYGVYALLNSTLYDQYYRILNGSTQVNSTEVNAMPIPPASTISKIGAELSGKPLTTAYCDQIVEKWI
ncbi:MAG: DNA methyltransferase [Bacteroidales bacterium]|nr:DNA methyltransferase [Bacteroidales bacterium]